MTTITKAKIFAGLWAACILTACSGGDRATEAGIGGSTLECAGRCQDTPTALSVEDAKKIIAQTAIEAQARNRPAIIAITDRVGNVLAVYRMDGAPAAVRVGSPTSAGPITGGLEGVSLVPAALSAISKAITGAYLSSEGNAFSTRTASQIIQANFNPGERNQPGGPLSGVQFSQLPCSDLSARFQADIGAGPGPQRSPLGLSADPGGMPLYKNGTVVGGIGVEADGTYSLDPSLFDRDEDIDEMLAEAGSFGYRAPTDRRADRITVEGKTLRYSDLRPNELPNRPAAATDFDQLTAGTLIAVRGYTPDTPMIVAGTAFGQNASGVAPATTPGFAERDAFFLVDRDGNNRYPARADAVGNLSETEVRQLLLSAIDVANRARAQIRRPLNSQVRVTVSVVGKDGSILGIVRTRDAPIFGTDVSLQKARTALIFSDVKSTFELLEDLPPAGYLTPDSSTPTELRRIDFGSYIAGLQQFFGTNSSRAAESAFGARSVGNIARPFFPDGVLGRVNGPLSKPAGEWSPFSTGLQLDLGYNAVVRHVAFVAGLVPDDVGPVCAGVAPLGAGLASAAFPIPASANNGIQIFAGGVPIYRGNQLIGGIGVSGDGIEQDDMVAFLGLHQAGVVLGGSIGNAPKEARIDQVEVGGIRLRYIACPQAPFLDSTEQGVCDGL